MITIGQRVQCFRDSYGLTRDELCAKMGVRTTETIAKIEKGTAKPQPNTILKLAQAFGCSFVEFIRGTDFEASISQLRVIPSQTVITYCDENQKTRTLYHPDENAPPYSGGECERFRCYRGHPHMHCCRDCEEYNFCDVRCMNDPHKCGLYVK